VLQGLPGAACRPTVCHSSHCVCSTPPAVGLHKRKFTASRVSSQERTCLVREYLSIFHVGSFRCAQILEGKSFKTEVVRDDVVIGAAWSIGSGGEVAAEVNHPGGE
jgi:hypothetical protein